MLLIYTDLYTDDTHVKQMMQCPMRMSNDTFGVLFQNQGILHTNNFLRLKYFLNFLRDTKKSGSFSQKSKALF